MPPSASRLVVWMCGPGCAFILNCFGFEFWSKHYKSLLVFLLMRVVGSSWVSIMAQPKSWRGHHSDVVDWLAWAQGSFLFGSVISAYSLHSDLCPLLHSCSICITVLFQRDQGHFYGYVYFRQVRDKSLKRGYFQKVRHFSPCKRTSYSFWTHPLVLTLTLDGMIRLRITNTMLLLFFSREVVSTWMS